MFRNFCKQIWCLIFPPETFLFTFSWKLYSLASPLSPHLSAHHIYKVYSGVCLQTGDGKYTFIHAMRLTVLGSKDNRLYVDLNLDQGNFLCLIDWKFLLPLSFKRFIGLKNYGLISSFFTKLKGKVRISMGFQSTDRS